MNDWMNEWMSAIIKCIIISKMHNIWLRFEMYRNKMVLFRIQIEKMWEKIIKINGTVLEFIKISGSVDCPFEEQYRIERQWKYHWICVCVFLFLFYFICFVNISLSLSSKRALAFISFLHFICNIPIAMKRKCMAFIINGLFTFKWKVTTT